MKQIYNWNQWKVEKYRRVIPYVYANTECKGWMHSRSSCSSHLVTQNQIPAAKPAVTETYSRHPLGEKIFSPGGLTKFDEIAPPALTKQVHNMFFVDSDRIVVLTSFLMSTTVASAVPMPFPLPGNFSFGFCGIYSNLIPNCATRMELVPKIPVQCSSSPGCTRACESSLLFQQVRSMTSTNWVIIRSTNYLDDFLVVINYILYICLCGFDPAHHA